MLEPKEFTALRTLPFVVYAVLQTVAAATPAADTSPLPAAVYTVSRSWPLGGAGGWDYLALEASGARLFISRGDRVDVVETVSVFELDTLRVIQRVPVSGKKPDAILYEPRQNHVITANGESANLSALD